MRGTGRKALTGLIAWGLTATIAGCSADTPAAAPPPTPSSTQARPEQRAHTTPSPRLITKLPGGDKRVALTIDDGPSKYTPQVLDVLKRYQVPATFCMVGEEAASHPDLVRMVLGAGMAICDHTMTHNERIAKLPKDQQSNEILGGRQAIIDTARRTGPAPDIPFLRTPGGAWSPALQQFSAQNGMSPLGWSVDPDDWRKPSVQTIVNRVDRQVTPGSIILMHDGGGDRSRSVAALNQIIPWLQSQGYTFTIPPAGDDQPPTHPG